MIHSLKLVLTVPCRLCGAKPGEPCVVVNGKSNGTPVEKHPHSWRIEDALNALKK